MNPFSSMCPVKNSSKQLSNKKLTTQLSNYKTVGEPDLQNLPTDCHTDEADDAEAAKDEIKKYAKEIYMILSYKKLRILQKPKRKLQLKVLGALVDV